jgi:hypothetical protein
MPGVPGIAAQAVSIDPGCGTYCRVPECCAASERPFKLRIVTGVGVVGRYVCSPGQDRDRLRETGNLPSARRLVGEGYVCQPHTR